MILSEFHSNNNSIIIFRFKKKKNFLQNPNFTWCNPRVPKNITRQTLVSVVFDATDVSGADSTPVLKICSDVFRRHCY